MFNWIQTRLEGGREWNKGGYRQESKMVGHERRPTLSKGEPKPALRCSNAQALFQVPAGPFRSLHPHGTQSAASEQLDFTICGTFLCSTWFPRGSGATGMPEAGELLLMQGTESLGQQHEGGARGEEVDLLKDWHGLERPESPLWHRPSLCLASLIPAYYIRCCTASV